VSSANTSTTIVFLNVKVHCTPVLVSISKDDCVVNIAGAGMHVSNGIAKSTKMIQLTTTMHEKAMSKHLYILPHSCHSKVCSRALLLDISIN
jgi:hypothetical protein